MTTTSAQVVPGWEAVRDAFEANFRDRDEVGAAVAVTHRGRLVVDLVGGHRDRDRTVPYGPDALQLVFSTTKGVAAVCVALCVQRGWLDPAGPVRAVWPDFPADLSVEQVMSHQAGLVTIEPARTMDELLDWETAVASLMATTPAWEPGTRHGYHAITYGWLAGELVRRSDPRHRSIGTFLAEEASAPLGLDLWIGLPDGQQPRVARLLAGAPPEDPELLAQVAARMGPGTLGEKALTVSGAFPMTGRGLPWNRPEVRAAELAGANAVTNARSLARLYGATVASVDGVRLLDAATVDEARRPRVDGPDACLATPSRFGLGFMLDGPFCPMLGPGSFGHPGAGGSLAFADPEAEVGFAYVMNQMQTNLAGDPRAGALVDAVRSCL